MGFRSRSERVTGIVWRNCDERRDSAASRFGRRGGLVSGLCFGCLGHSPGGSAFSQTGFFDEEEDDRQDKTNEAAEVTKVMNGADGDEFGTMYEVAGQPPIDAFFRENVMAIPTADGAR